MKRTQIIIHTEELDPIGIEIEPIRKVSERVKIPHRDDHYMFIIQRSGFYSWELDFREVQLSGSYLFYLAPGQVHRCLANKDVEGWFVFLETHMIPDKYAEIFNTYLNSDQAVWLSETHQLYSLLPVFKSVLDDQGIYFQQQVVNALKDSLMGLIASALVQTQQAEKLVGGQKYQTLNRFKQLVQTNYKEIKEVKEYALQLNITPLYLNEVVRQLTGFAASYWIQQAIITEAKRLLFYTDLDIKQVAFELGYEDYAYFSRFFKKNAGITATDFRSQKP